MATRTQTFGALCALACGSLPALLLAYPGGADPGNTGPADGRSCARSGCHQTQANIGPGRINLALSGNGSYRAGETQTVTVTVEPNENTVRVYGFQASPRLASNTRSGSGGRLSVSSSNMEAFCASAVPTSQRAECSISDLLSFAGHTDPIESNTFSFDWTPPDNATGDIQLFIAVNGANGNGRNDPGDRIYTTDVTIRPAGSNPPPATATISSVVNAASGSADTGIASNTLFAITGANLTPVNVTRDWSATVGSGQAPTSLEDVSVKVNGRDAFVTLVSRRDGEGSLIHVIAPEDDATGDVPVEVRTPDGTTVTTTIRRAAVAPALYAFDSEGRRFVSATAASPFAVIAPGAVTLPGARAARPGEYVTLTGTGFGVTSPAQAAGAVPQFAVIEPKPQVTIGGRAVPDAEVEAYVFKAVGQVFLSVRVPEALDTGEHEVVVRVRDVAAPTALLSVRR